MGNFTRNDLRYSYDWRASEGDNKRITGFPDDVLLNRNEGYEVLYFINKYMTNKSWQQLSTFQKLESTIKNDLPSNIRSHNNVRNWLDNNFRI